MQKDRAILIEIDKKKNEQIEWLEEQLNQMKANGGQKVKQETKSTVNPQKAKKEQEALLAKKEEEHQK